MYDSSSQSFYWTEIPFAYYDVFPSLLEPDNFFNADTVDFDYLMLLDDVDTSGVPTHSWVVNLAKPAMGDPFRNCCSQPNSGDTLYIDIKKPFLSSDIYEFTTKGAKVNTDLASDQLKNIFVIPNPYIAANAFEAQNIYSSGRGPREIQFRKLPANCTIRIYTVSGERVKTIDHFTSIDDGMETWDLLSKDNLSVSYGVYIYHVEAPGIGEHIGRFALIK